MGSSVQHEDILRDGEQVTVSSVKLAKREVQSAAQESVCTFRFLQALLNTTLWLSLDQQQCGRDSYTPANSAERSGRRLTLVCLRIERQQLFDGIDVDSNGRVFLTMCMMCITY